MERKNAIKYLKIYTLGTALLIISFPLVFTPLFNSIEISPTFEAIINSGFIGMGIAWLVFTLKAIQTIIFIIRSKPSTNPKDEVKTSKKEDSSKMDFIQSPFFLFVGFSIVFLLIIYISNNNSEKTINYEDDTKQAIELQKNLSISNENIEKSKEYLNNGINNKADAWDDNDELLEGKIYESIFNLSKAIELNPNNTEGYRERAQAYKLLEDLNSAYKDLDKAIEINPNEGENYFYRGLIEEDPNLEIYYYTKSIELKNGANYSSSYANRARAKEKTGDYFGAIEDITYVIENFPYKLEGERFWNYETRADIKIRGADFEGACKDYYKALELVSNDDFRKQILNKINNFCQ
jgi:tetratricopeptide (TPR) repeat protein